MRVSSMAVLGRFLLRVGGTLVVLLCVALPAQGAIVRLRSAARISSAVVTLGDVAEVLDADAQIVARLESITLAPAPPAGSGERWIDYETIRQRLQAHGVNLAEVEFTGSSRIRVTGAPGASRAVRNTVAAHPAATAPTRPIAAASRFQVRQAEAIVTRAIQEYVRREAPQAGEVAVEPQFEPQQVDLLLAAGRDGCAVTAGPLVWDAPQPFTLRCRAAGGAVREITVPCRVVPLPAVLTVRHTVPKGHCLQASDLTWTQTATSDGALAHAESAVGLEATRTLHPNQPIRPDDVMSVPLIRAGDMVTLLVRRPGLTARRIMKARTGGTRGETVTLTTLDNRESLTAVVSGYHQAETVGTTPAGASIQDSTGTIQFVPHTPSSHH